MFKPVLTQQSLQSVVAASSNNTGDEEDEENDKGEEVTAKAQRVRDVSSPLGDAFRPSSSESSSASSGVRKTGDECALGKEYAIGSSRPIGVRLGLTRQSRLEVALEHRGSHSLSFVTFKFRTVQPDGVLLAARGSVDYLLVWLRDGRVHYAHDGSASSAAAIRMHSSRDTYADGRFHTLTLQLSKSTNNNNNKNNANKATLRVSLRLADAENVTLSEPPVVAETSVSSSSSSGDASPLRLRSPVLLGNLAEWASSWWSEATNSSERPAPFAGCMSHMRVQHAPLTTRNTRIVDAANCTSSQESGLFFTGEALTSYARLDSTLHGISLADTLNVQFDMRARTKNGVLLYIGTSAENNINYALLELVNGSLVFKLVVDGYERQVTYDPASTSTSTSSLCSGRWTRVRLHKDRANSYMSLTVQGDDGEAAATSEQRFGEQLSALIRKAQANANVVYIGALPARALYAEISASSEPFVGCVRHMSVSVSAKTATHTRRFLLFDAVKSESGGVLNYCPSK